ncbi:MAG: bdbD [Pedosphaera sp.]|jgi:protein-disulfide isomerase|nr:bdbD [Pedosphaera sp.]
MKTESTIPLSKLTLPVGKRDHIQGPITAPKTLLEYGDYECPFCGAAYGIVKAVQQTLGPELCFAFRNFPLTNMHPHAEHSAEAAEAAGAQGKFWEMHDMLYENQNALEDEDLARYAAELGLDVPRLIREVETGAHKKRIREDFMSGVRSGVNGTPTFFINGVRHDGAYDYDILLAAIIEAEPLRK